MVKIEKNGTIIKIDGIEISIEEYNKRHGWYKNDEYAIKEEYEKLSKEIFISRSKPKPGTDGSKSSDYYSTEEYLKEMEKVKKVNPNAYYEAEKIEKEIEDLEAGQFQAIGSIALGNAFEDDETKIKQFVELNNKKRIEKLLVLYKKILPKLRQVFTQKEETGNDWGNDYNDPNKDKSREELGKRANEIESYRKKVKGEIEAELNKNPKITNEDLETDNQEWEVEIWNSHIALGEKEIDGIKSRVLTDISTKRAAKQGKRKRENEENDNSNDNPNKKPKFDDKDKENFQSFKNSVVDKISDDELAAGLWAMFRNEGEAEFKDEVKMKVGEDELIKRNPQLYQQTVIEALKQRANDNEVDIEKLSEKSKQLINGQITDAEEVKAAKNQAIKEIGEFGAKSKWTSLIEQANALFAKAKKKVTEKVKEDLKTIQEQLKNFKAGTNSYLNSVYQDNKARADKLERDLSSISTTNQAGSPKETPWGVIIPVSLVAVALIGIVAVIIVRKKRQQSKVEETID